MPVIKSKDIDDETAAIELALKRAQLKAADWSSPIALAIVAALVAGVGNAVALVWNGQLENRRAEHARILEVLRTGNREQAAENLDFLAKTGLISDVETSNKIRQYIDNAKPGTGPVLPSWVTREHWSNFVPTYNGNTDHVNVSSGQIPASSATK